MIRTAWSEHFPNTVIDRKLGDAKSHRSDINRIKEKIWRT